MTGALPPHACCCRRPSTMPKKKRNQSTKKEKQRWRRGGGMIGQPCPNGLCCNEQRCPFLHMNAELYDWMLTNSPEKRKEIVKRMKHRLTLGQGRTFLCVGCRHDITVNSDKGIVVGDDMSSRLCVGCERAFCMECRKEFPRCDGSECDTPPRCNDCAFGLEYQLTCFVSGEGGQVTGVETIAVAERLGVLVSCQGKNCPIASNSFCALCCDPDNAPEMMHVCTRCDKSRCNSCRAGDCGKAEDADFIFPCCWCGDAFCGVCDPGFKVGINNSFRVCLDCVEKRYRTKGREMMLPKMKKEFLTTRVISVPVFSIKTMLLV